MPKSFQLARQFGNFLSVDPLALTGISAGVSSWQKTTLQLGKVGHVVSEEQVVDVWRPPEVVEHLQGVSFFFFFSVSKREKIHFRRSTNMSKTLNQILHTDLYAEITVVTSEATAALFGNGGGQANWLRTSADQKRKTLRGGRGIAVTASKRKKVYHRRAWIKECEKAKNERHRNRRLHMYKFFSYGFSVSVEI